MTQTIEIYDSSRRPSPVIEEFIEAVRYRDLIRQLVRRDILTRYKRSVLGVAWTMLNPLGMMIVLTVAFSSVFRFTQGFSVYLLTGLIVWNFFAQTTIAAMVNIVWGGPLLHRIYLPRTSFALSAVGTGLVNLTLAFVPLAAIMILTGIPVRPSVVFVPIAMLLLAAFTLGVGLLLSTLAVYFPDVAEMYQIVLQAWMYLTPIIYPEDIVPVPYRSLLFNLNPMYHLVKLFRLPLYYGVWPSLPQLASAGVVATVIVVVGWVVFTRKADEFAYRI